MLLVFSTTRILDMALEASPIKSQTKVQSIYGIKNVLKRGPTRASKTTCLIRTTTGKCRDRYKLLNASSRDP